MNPTAQAPTPAADSEGFDATVAGFYRAATGEMDWVEALHPVQALFKARVSLLQTVDLQSGALLQLHLGGPPMPEGALDYVRHWHRLDPRRGYLLGHLDEVLGHWWHCSEHCDEQFAQGNVFYRHFMPAHGARYHATILLSSSPTTVTGFGLELPAQRGPLDAVERVLAQRLGRHMHDALRAHERVRRMAAQALAGHQLLANFAYPMWLIDSDGFVFHANPAAQDEVAREQRVGASANRLSLRNADGERAFATHRHALASAGHGARAIVDARHSRADPPAWLHLMAVLPGQVMGAFGERPLILATLFSPDQMRGLDPFALGDVFGLTPTQARVAVLLAEGLTAAQIGLRLGVALSTVRTHLRQVLGRLGANRQADAVRLLRQGEALWASAPRAG